MVEDMERYGKIQEVTSSLQQGNVGGEKESRTKGNHVSNNEQSNGDDVVTK